jgi:hypothetical protein
LITRVPSGIHSGMQILSNRVGNSQIGISMVPPPTCRHAPTSAGSEVMARMACPPPRLRSIATPCRIAAGWVVAYSRARVRTSSAGMPVISSTRSGG